MQASKARMDVRVSVRAYARRKSRHLHPNVGPLALRSASIESPVCRGVYFLGALADCPGGSAYPRNKGCPLPWQYDRNVPVTIKANLVDTGPTATRTPPVGLNCRSLQN